MTTASGDGIELLTKKQIAKAIGVSTRSIDRWIDEGAFPRGVKIGQAGPKGLVRWQKSAIEKWIADQASQSV